MKPLYVYSDELLKYRFSDTHPFNQMRLKMTTDLLKAAGFLKDSDIVGPRVATEDEIKLVHTEDYVEAVKRAGHFELTDEELINFGLNTEDTPQFENMHEKCSMLVGATLRAVDLIMNGRAKKVTSLAGGLHHGFSGKASGFCIYNDAAIACEYLRQNFNQRVLYIDTDAHHGDGVQFIFYDNKDIMTYSIHETGRYLFPGTGHVTERGVDNGFGFSVNLPVDAFTEDNSYLEVFKESLERTAEIFQPDIIVSVNGVDAHYRDPMTHLSLTSKSYEEIPRFVNYIADKYAHGKWLALGGGGYNIWQVVPRAWAQVWLAMNDKEAPTGPLPQAFLEEYKPLSKLEFPESWQDDLDDYMDIPRRSEITEKNQLVLDRIMMYLE